MSYQQLPFANKNSRNDTVFPVVVKKIQPSNLVEVDTFPMMQFPGLFLPSPYPTPPHYQMKHFHLTYSLDLLKKQICEDTI